MTASITAAFSAFAQALTNVGFAILNAALAVFHAVIALFQEIATGVLSVAQAVVRLATDLVQDTLGFVFGERNTSYAGRAKGLTGRFVLANFFLIVVLGGVYYWYNSMQGTGRKGKRAKA